jgi:hypothetical protein
MNAIAAIKAMLRGHQEMARDLAVRGLGRVGVNVSAEHEDLGDLIVGLVQTVRTQDPQMSRLADQIIALHMEAFR